MRTGGGGDFLEEKLSKLAKVPEDRKEIKAGFMLKPGSKEKESFIDYE